MSVYGEAFYGEAFYGSGSVVPSAPAIKPTPIVPHFAIPFRIDGVKGARIKKQDSEAEILDCVEVILRYPQGHRPEKEEFGIPDLTFAESHVDERLIQVALNEWEPRIEMLVHQSELDALDQLIQKIRVEEKKSE